MAACVMINCSCQTTKYDKLLITTAPNALAIEDNLSDLRKIYENRSINSGRYNTKLVQAIIVGKIRNTKLPIKKIDD